MKYIIISSFKNEKANDIKTLVNKKLAKIINQKMKCL